MSDKTQVVEQQMQKLDDAYEQLLPRLGALDEQRQALSQELSGALVAEVMGKGGNGRPASRVREALTAVEQQMAEIQQSRQVIELAREQLRLELQACKLGDELLEYKALVPEVQALRDKYLSAREQVQVLSTQLRQKHSRASGLRVRVQERRHALAIEPQSCEDLPSLPSLNFADGKFAIDVDRLRGERKW
jgi:chromosome segregation ATPase